MIYYLADNITSPLGANTIDNLDAVRQGRTALRLHHLWDMPEQFMGSLFEEGMFEEKTFGNVVVASVQEALSHIPDLDVSTNRVGLVLSSTKGDTTVRIGRNGNKIEGKVFAETAADIARRIGITTAPVTVSNACISGLSAQIHAMRMLEQGLFDIIIVSGCDIQSKFIVSGFQSFKALSINECRPFDEDRNGLNLGEAAATVIMCSESVVKSLNRDVLPDAHIWAMIAGNFRNDAFHISGPSRTAEGSYRALREVLKDEDKYSIACVNAHGTATLYNDDMESRAIQRADLLDVPVNSLKGYFGHTMGAAGILETIITMHSVEQGWVIGTRGYNACGTMYELNMTPEHRPTDKTQFVKLMSGFGGCNAAALFKLKELSKCKEAKEEKEVKVFVQMKKLLSIHISSEQSYTTSDGVVVKGNEMLTHIYKEKIGGYPKFYKMDSLAKLGFIATELLLQQEQQQAEAHPEQNIVPRFTEREDRAIVFINRSASLAADNKYEETIQTGDNYFPSPADFVYTLPNIVTGEIAIRNKYYGESNFLCFEDESKVDEIVQSSFLDGMTRSVIGGWLECSGPDCFDATLSIYVKE